MSFIVEVQCFSISVFTDERKKNEQSAKGKFGAIEAVLRDTGARLRGARARERQSLRRL